MKPPDRGARTRDRRYRRQRDHIKATEDTCWLCGQWIDPDLPTNHPRSFNADHVIPVSMGGSNHGRLRASHKDCNQRRGAKLPNPTLIRHGKQW